MDLTNDIISYIFTEKQLSLPGLGTLYLKQSSASRSPSKRKIYGPKFDIQLEDTEYDSGINGAFYQYVANKNKKSINQIEDEVHKYSISLLNDLANYGKANINNLGFFKRANNKLQFEFSPVFQELLGESYPDLPLLLIDRKENKENIVTKSEKSQDITAIDGVRNKKHNKPGWIFPLIVLTLLSLGFVCLMYCLSEVIPGDNTYKEHSNKKNSTLIATGKDTTKKEKQTDTTAIAKPIDTVKSQIQKQRKPENVKNDRRIVNPVTTVQERNLEKIPLAKLIDMSDSLKKSFDKSCIIIVGSFKRKSNSIRMKNRLVRSKFTPYVEKYGKFYRTGVVFDCNEKPLYEFLEELRSSIDKNSWVLKYK